MTRWATMALVLTCAGVIGRAEAAEIFVVLQFVAAAARRVDHDVDEAGSRVPRLQRRK